MSYVIIDTKRGKYWKYNDYGYTTNVLDAKIFSKEEAEEKVNAPGVKDLIMYPVMKSIDELWREMDEKSEICNHADKILKENRGIVFTLCNECGLVLSSEKVK